MEQQVERQVEQRAEVMEIAEPGVASPASNISA